MKRNAQKNFFKNNQKNTRNFGGMETKEREF
jgi:hypothetical protein